jgi:hypothetical protein
MVVIGSAHAGPAQRTVVVRCRRCIQSRPSAFDKYERGLIEPSGPTIQLITLLEPHPELIADLQGDAAYDKQKAVPGDQGPEHPSLTRS